MRSLSLFVLLSLSACAPRREVTPDQVQALTKLTDVMDAQSTYADPLFKKRDQQSFTDAEFASFVDVSARLQATSLKAKDFSKGPDFDKMWATMMITHHTGAVTMAKAVQIAGSNADVRMLAGAIIAAQEAEIAELGKLVG